MIKRKSVLLLLLLAWVGFCLVWFFTIYQKEGKKSANEDEIVINNEKPEVITATVATDTIYSNPVTSSDGDTSQKTSTDDATVAVDNRIDAATSQSNSNAGIDNNTNNETKKIEPVASLPGVESNKKLSVCYFYQNSDKKVKNFSPRIAKKIEQYLASDNAKIAITGHTDYVGTTEYNYRLGLQRAERVKQLLIKKGIAAERIVVLSKGEEQPVANNKSIAGRAKNRRVEINITLS